MIYISIGSNVGHRLANIQHALILIEKEMPFEIIQQSPIIETEALLPVGAPDAWNCPYLNMIIAGKSDLSLDQLLEKLQKIERQCGRASDHEKWSPRTMDLDILLVDDRCMDAPHLQIPHPGLAERPFLIHLMTLMAPNFIHPILKKSFVELAYQYGQKMACFEKSFVAFPRFIGIINVTDDSFSDGGINFKPEDAIDNALRLHDDGASVIDIGAQSTRPGASTLVTPEEEYQRLIPVLEGLREHIDQKSLCISLDSCSPYTIRQVLEKYPIHWINDVKGIVDKACLSDIHAHQCRYMVMHSLTIPHDNREILPFTEPLASHLLQWAKEKAAYLEQFGFSNDQIVFDPGIGFGKSPYQNLMLLKQIDILKALGFPICIGHSRKSFLRTVTGLETSQRDIETMAVSDCLAALNVDYLRVHNVSYHQRFFATRLICQQLQLGAALCN